MVPPIGRTMPEGRNHHCHQQSTTGSFHPIQHQSRRTTWTSQKSTPSCLRNAYWKISTQLGAPPWYYQQAPASSRPYHQGDDRPVGEEEHHHLATHASLARRRLRLHHFQAAMAGNRQSWRLPTATTAVTTTPAAAASTAHQTPSSPSTWAGRRSRQCRSRRPWRSPPSPCPPSPPPHTHMHTLHASTASPGIRPGRRRNWWL
jgi:hypothetical protein